MYNYWSGKFTFFAFFHAGGRSTSVEGNQKVFEITVHIHSKITLWIHGSLDKRVEAGLRQLFICRVSNTDLKLFYLFIFVFFSLFLSLILIYIYLYLSNVWVFFKNFHCKLIFLKILNFIKPTVYYSIDEKFFTRIKKKSLIVRLEIFSFLLYFLSK